jgi:hypothetical protein
LTSERPVLGRALALGFAGLTLAGCSSIGPDGRLSNDPLGNFEQEIIGNTLSGIGVTAPRQEPIQYAPRAPLAMPPRGRATAGQLPPPQERVVASTPANWPQDRDVLRRQAAAREAAMPERDRERERQRPMTVEEAEAQRAATRVLPGARAPDVERPDRFTSREDLERGAPAASGNSIFTVDETVDVTRGRDEGRGSAQREVDSGNLFGGGGLNRAATQRLDTTRLSRASEPERRSIAEPPRGYRAPAPDPTGGRMSETDLANRPVWERWLGIRQ